MSWRYLATIHLIIAIMPTMICFVTKMINKYQVGTDLPCLKEKNRNTKKPRERIQEDRQKVSSRDFHNRGGKRRLGKAKKRSWMDLAE